jgi:uncharacterized protein (TIGR03382 family)
MNTSSKTNHRFTRRTKKLLTGLALSSGLGLGTSLLAHADPNYASVNNPLGNRTHLLRDDDLIVTTGTEYANGAQTRWVSPVEGVGFTQCRFGVGIGCLMSGRNYDHDAAPITGRFFKTATDAIVVLPTSMDGVSAKLFTMLGDPTGGGYSIVGQGQALDFTATAFGQVQSAVADFNGDGYDDIFLAYVDANGWAVGRIASATDVNDPTKGFTMSAPQKLGFSYGIRSLVVGDFTGTGRNQAALLYIDPNKDPNISVYGVDASQNITLLQNNWIDDSVPDYGADQPLQLATGRFTGGVTQIALTTTDESFNTKIRLYEVNPDNNYPYEKGSIEFPYASNVKLAAGAFDWSQPNDMLAVMLTTVNGSSSSSGVQLLKFDSVSYTPSVAASLDVPSAVFGSTDKKWVALDIAVGNFDNHYAGNAGPCSGSDCGGTGGTPSRNPNLQLAVAGGYVAGQYNSFVNPGPNQFTLGRAAAFDVTANATGIYSFQAGKNLPVLDATGHQGNVTYMSLATADLRGKSLRLGQSYKITLDKMSPTMILAQPPSHVDFALKNTGSTVPEVLNLSLAPDKYFASFTQTGNTTQSASTSKTKGWGYAGTQSIGGTVTFGSTTPTGALNSGVQVSDTFTAQQAIDHSTDKTFGTSTSAGLTISSSTNASDQVFYDDGTTYLYVYDVVGQTACSNGAATCDASQQVPQSVMFSAPGGTQSYISDGNTLDWYQPVWENGNILSYPGNLQQITPLVPQFDQVNKSQTLQTDTSSTAIQTSWSGTQNAQINVTTSKVFKEDNALSVEIAGGISVGPLGGAGASAKLSTDFGGSTSFGSVRTNSTTVTNATGITLTKSAQFPTYSQYGYSFLPIIYGQDQPPSYFDGTDPNTNVAPKPTALDLFGALRTAFTVNPQDSNSGAWWKHTYAAGAPDIAFNHPARWGYAKYGTSQQMPGTTADTCVPTGDGYQDCAYQQLRDATDPAGDSFYRMRGLFVTRTSELDATTLTNGGMQQTTATAGDQMTLQARVYNYSFANPAPYTVHVNFYGMYWNSSTGFPADRTSTDPGTSSFLIGSTLINGGIQPFDATSYSPNYAMAKVQFDTTKYADKDILFWVAAWATDENGLVTELPGKGWTSIPSNLTTPKLTDFASVEELQSIDGWEVNLGSLGVPTATSFSNNIGVYHTPFHVLAPVITGSLGAGAHDTVDTKALKSSEVHVKAVDLALGQATEISATVHNDSTSPQIATAFMYEGDPDAGGRLFGVQRLVHVGAGADYKVRVRYEAQTCGDHDLFMKVNRNDVVGPKTKALETVHVACPTPGQPPHDDGCNAAGSSSPWSMFAMVGVAIAWVRRRRKAAKLA